MAVPLVIVAFMLATTDLDGVRTRESAVWVALLFAVVFTFAGMITVTYMSLAYRHLAPDPETIAAQ